MSEHLLTTEIQNYLSRAMEPTELLKADDHLAECDLCHRQLGDAELSENTADFLEISAEDSEHLSYEQLANYVDEKSDNIEREIADVHLQACVDCAADLQGLFEMRRLITADLQNQAEKENEKSIFAKIGNFFAAGFIPRLGFAALVVLLLSVGVFWLISRKSSPEIAVMSPTATANLAQNQNNSTPLENDSENIDAETAPLTPTPTAVKTFPPKYQAEIERVLAENRLNFPNELSQLKNQTGKLMSGGTQEVPFAVISPVGKIILSNRPRFSWKALSGVTVYIVNVYDANFNPVASSPQISGTNWQPNKPLSGGKIYNWQVTAFKDGQEIKSPIRPAPDARFKIIEARKAGELARLSNRYKNEHLFLGILYANAGLLDEAERQFQKEISKNPNSKQARKLLLDVRAKRRAN